MITLFAQKKKFYSQRRNESVI